MDKRYFICRKNCRLSDLNLSLDEGQIFERRSEEIESSRAIRAATNAKWVEEIDEEEFNKLVEERKKILKKKEKEELKEVNLKEVNGVGGRK